MPTSLSHWAGALSVVIVIGSSALYAAAESLVRRWRSRRGSAPAGRPQVYRDLAAEARERQVRVERLTWAVDRTLADALEAVGPYYDTTAFTDRPADEFGAAFLEGAARTHGLHHR